MGEALPDAEELDRERGIVMFGLDPLWSAFLSGALIGAALAVIVLWLIPAIREYRADRIPRGNADVIDLTRVRLQRNLREDLRARWGGR